MKNTNQNEFTAL